VVFIPPFNKKFLWGPGAVFTKRAPGLPEAIVWNKKETDKFGWAGLKAVFINLPILHEKIRTKSRLERRSV
jgi:hypothetical protein